MSLKWYGADVGHYILTMVAFSGGRQVLNNIRVCLISDKEAGGKGDHQEQIKKLIDFLDSQSKGNVKYVRQVLGYPVADKPGYDIGTKYRKGLIGYENPTSTMHKQWINLPFIDAEMDTQDVEQIAAQINNMVNLGMVVRLPRVDDPEIIIPTKSAFCAKAISVGRNPADFTASGQTFDDNAVDGMSGSDA